ncbi:Lysophospholipase L1-like esterase [Frankia sp. AiPs1]|uniref:GDSL-type esterase/lipase family protein n=1 Tax=Frankia sp. AiPa1 TaxID=573492 RepID=UPI00202B064A|nr:GDSL-type esterase/lipase family protein [Frankia sp. AiPa1]MCL9761004.1 GDSL-type esterase/lipase family protein [Frankia sp. AiPa1]
MAGPWTTAHLAALADPDETPPFVPQPRVFAGQTVRQSIRLRRGGTALRLVLSNEFGRTPLVFEGVTVSDGPAGAVLPVLRHGRARWEIPPGETVTSDPVDLPTAAGADLLVSCFTAGAARPGAFLHSAQRTGGVAPGDQRSRSTMTDAETFPSLYWITRVLTDAPAKRPTVLALGDSITRGDGTTVDREQRYPDHLQRRLIAAGIGDAIVLNAGIGANRLLKPGVGPSMIDRFDRDVLGITEATHVVIMAGINDIAGPDHPSADDITQGLFTLADRARNHGIQAILGTITPFGASVYASFRADGNEDIRQSVNHTVTTQDEWPAADFAAAVAAPHDPTRLARQFDAGDGVHLSDVGARALADAVNLTDLT